MAAVKHYQIKYQCGYEIICEVAIDDSVVMDQYDHVAFEGSFEECEKWLKDRGIKPL